MDKNFQMEGLIDLRITLIKEQNQKNEDQIEKKQQKIWLNDEIERKKTSTKMLRIKLEI